MFFEVINYITYTVFRERKREREKVIGHREKLTRKYTIL